MRGFKYSIPLEIWESDKKRAHRTHVRWKEGSPLIMVLAALRPWHD
jgi:hypothetical protein